MVQILEKGYTPSEALRPKLLEIHEILSKHSASIVATHISGEKNSVADLLSRANIGDAWQLKRSIFDAIQSSTTPCTIDRFAC